MSNHDDDDDADVPDILQSLIDFLLQPDNTVPDVFQRCLREPARLEHRFIATFFAKVLRHLQSQRIPIIPTNNSLPPSTWFAIIHPSSQIRYWALQTITQSHTKGTIGATQINLIQPVLREICQKLSFGLWTPDAAMFDTREGNVSLTQKGIAAFLKQSTDTKELRTVQYVESHLYSGLKTILSLLNDSAFDQILANRSLSNLWNVLLNGFDVDIEKRGGALSTSISVLCDCCFVVRQLLQCTNHCLLWEQCSINAEQFTTKCLEALKLTLQAQGNNAQWINAQKSILECIEVFITLSVFLNVPLYILRFRYSISLHFLYW